MSDPSITIESIITRGVYTTPEDFSSAVEDFVKRRRISYFEGLSLFCEEHGWDAPSLAKSLTSSLRSKIRAEATKLHLLKPSKRKL